jgi:hypothetical protein
MTAIFLASLKRAAKWLVAISVLVAVAAVALLRKCAATDAGKEARALLARIDGKEPG